MPIPKTYKPIHPLAKPQAETESPFKEIKVEQRLIDFVFTGGLVKALTLEPGDILNDSDATFLSIRFVAGESEPGNQVPGSESEILVNMANVLFIEKATRTITKKIPIDPLAELRKAETSGSIQ